MLKAPVIRPLQLFFTIVIASFVFLGCNDPSELSKRAMAATTNSASPSGPSSSAVQMKESAMAFIASLSTDAREKGMFELTDEQARTNWSNLPASLFDRSGVRVGDLSDDQRRLLHNLIRSSTSSQGYLKISSLFWMEDILHEQSKERFEREGGSDFFAQLIESWTSDNYWVSFFADPAEDATWGWMITGHHLAASFTISDDQVAFTPLFLGAEPYEVEKGTFAGWRALSHEVERGFELLHALSAEQQQQVVLNQEIPRDIFEGPGRKGSLENFEGLVASELSDNQKKMLWHLIEEYVNNADHDAADVQIEKIQRDGYDKLYFSWIGPTDDISKRYYYRVHGPSILIEYIRERGVGGDQEAANHVHSIVRDPSNDYGEDWLEMHYKEHHNVRPRR